jgi:hypothetical protein
MTYVHRRQPGDLSRYSDCYELEGPGFQTGNNFFSSPMRQEKLWGPPSLFNGLRRGSIGGVGLKRPRRGVNHLPPSSSGVKNEWRYTSTPPICLNGVVSEKLHIHVSLDKSYYWRRRTTILRKPKGEYITLRYVTLRSQQPAMDPMCRTFLHHLSNILAHAYCSLRIARCSSWYKKKRNCTYTAHSTYWSLFSVLSTEYMLRWGSGLELWWHRVRIQAVPSVILTFYFVRIKPYRWRPVWFLAQATTASLQCISNHHPPDIIPDVKYIQCDHNLFVTRIQLQVLANI